MEKTEIVKNNLNADDQFVVPPMLIRTLEAGGFFRANSSFLTKVGFSEAELAEGSFLSWIDPNDVKVATATIEGNQSSCQVAHRTKEGEHFPLQIRVVENGGKPIVLAHSLEDAEVINSPEDSEDEATVRGTLHTIARIVEEQNPGYKCSILLVADGRFVRGAGPSLPEEYNAAIDGYAIGPTVGSCGTAIYWNVPVIVEDIQADPLWVPIAELAKKAGVAACWSYPFSSRTGNVLGALAFYSPVPRRPTKEQLGRLKAFARMTGLAVERGRAEEALVESEKQYKELIHSIQAAVFVHDNDTKIIACNAKSQELLGLTENQMLGKTATDPDWEFLNSEGTRMPANEYPVNKVLSSKQSLRDYTVGIYDPKKNDPTWGLVYADPIFDNEGKIQHVVVTFFDITERKKAEENLKKQHYYLEKAQELGQIGTWELDLINNILYWTDENCKIFGVPEESVVDYETFLSRVHPEDREYVDLEWKASIDGKLYDIEHRLLIDGRVKWVREKADLEFDENGKAIRAIGVTQDITELKEAELSRRESEEKYRKMAANIADTIWEIDLKTLKFTYVNPSFEHISGFSDQEIINSNLEDLFTPKSLKMIMKALSEELIAEESGTAKPRLLELEHLHKNGSTFWAEISARFIRNAEGRPYGIVGVTRDITERREMEKTLASNEAKFRFITENMSDIVWTIDMNFQLTYVSPSVEKILGYTPKERMELPFEKHVTQESFNKIMTKLQEELERDKKPGVDPEREILIEVEYFCKDGSIVWMENSIRAIRNEFGEPIGMHGVSRNIMDRKRAEKALQESEAKLKLALEAGGIGTWRWVDGVNEWDGLLHKVYERSESPKNHSEWERTIHPDDLEGLIEKERNWLETGQCEEVTFRTITPQDKIKWILSRAQVIKNDDGNINGLIGVSMDITNIKQAEQNKIELENQRHIMQKIESIGILAGGIAHDFNNMLAVIIGNISYAMSDLSKDDELYKILANVQTSSKRAQGLTQQLLTFAKGGEPIKEVSDINSLLKESAIFSTRGSMTNCDFDLSSELWLVEVDQGQFNQAISNLIINANQAMPKGGTITIRTENIEFNNNYEYPLSFGKYIRIVIEDQGAGIAQKYLSNIFDPYFTTKQKGSGLGLSTTYSIIKKHGGHITVDSMIEKGTIFNIFLPAASSDSVIEIMDKEEHIHVGQGRILIMDDQEQILEMAKMMLNNMGYDVACAKDGTQAIKMYRESLVLKAPFDLAILDLTVPGGMGGTKTVSELSKIDPNLKAVVSSGYSNDPIMANYEDYGFCGVIPKPYTKSQLSEVLNKILCEKK